MADEAMLKFVPCIQIRPSLLLLGASWRIQHSHYVSFCSSVLCQLQAHNDRFL